MIERSSSMAGSVASPLSEVGDRTGAGPAAGAATDSSPDAADVREVDGTSAAPVIM